MKERMKIAHMRAAEVYANLSYCQRKKVGCVIVKGDKVISIGYNGTPPGEDNCCEEDGRTKPNVIHAEDNAMRKCSRFDLCCSSLFVTMAPCIECAKKILSSGITNVYYKDIYRSLDGLYLLEANGIQTEKVVYD